VAVLESEQMRFTAFGVPMEVTVPARLYEGARALTPPGATTFIAGENTAKVAVEERNGTLRVFAGGTPIGMTEDEELALGMLDAQIRAQVALLAPEHIFVHAGVVAVDGEAVLLPGFTFTGKTTLTHALVEAGAVYYSDEFAVIDAAGLVHPYAKPLSIRRREGSGHTTETHADSLGAVTGREPVPVGLIAVTSYRPGATLDPEPLAPGAALLALLGHTIPARTRPEQAMAALKATVQVATAWKSDRGEADVAARAIIESMAHAGAFQQPAGSLGCSRG
jgi:hypothetical protein